VIRCFQKMLSTVMYAYQSFFDTTPLGRILNRFSQDQYLIDEGLPDSFASVFNMFFSVMSTMIVITMVTPLFLVLIIPLVALYAFTQRFYVASSRELKRLESVTKSPIFAQFSETLNGTVTIRAYGDHHRFVAANHVKLDVNQKAYFLGTVANRWLAVRLEMIGAVIVTGASLFAIIARSSISPALAGLSISYALSITQNLNWFVRVTAEVESKIVAVERLREFSVLPVEPSGNSSTATVPRNWPSEVRRFITCVPVDVDVEATCVHAVVSGPRCV
jgi:ATP-binding cassette, subfamily C (CFTR/MRP), member 1